MFPLLSATTRSGMKSHVLIWCCCKYPTKNIKMWNWCNGCVSFLILPHFQLLARKFQNIKRTYWNIMLKDLIKALNNRSKVASRTDSYLVCIISVLQATVLFCKCMHENNKSKSIHSYNLFVCISLFAASHPSSLFSFTQSMLLAVGLNNRKHKIWIWISKWQR